MQKDVYKRHIEMKKTLVVFCKKRNNLFLIKRFIQKKSISILDLISGTNLKFSVKLEKLMHMKKKNKKIFKVKI